LPWITSFILQESQAAFAKILYPGWKPEYEQYIKAQADALNHPDFNSVANVNAITFQVIYGQPVCYEWDRITHVFLFLKQ